MIRIHVCADRRDQNMSRICNEQLKLHVQGKKSRFSDPKLGGKPIGESYVACNSAKVKDVGAQNNWAEFRNEVERQYNQLCMGDEKFSAMFCTECGIIAERILAANNEATGDGCFDGEALKGVPTTAPGEATTIQEKKGG